MAPILLSLSVFFFHPSFFPLTFICSIAAWKPWSGTPTACALCRPDLDAGDAACSGRIISVDVHGHQQLRTLAEDAVGLRCKGRERAHSPGGLDDLSRDPDVDGEDGGKGGEVAPLKRWWRRCPAVEVCCARQGLEMTRDWIGSAESQRKVGAK